MWFLFSSLLLICILIWDYFLKRRRYSILKKSKIKGPFTWPIIGDVLESIGSDTLNIFSLLERFGTQFGKLYRLWVFHRLMIVVKEPKHLEFILSSPQLIKKHFFYDIVSCWLGDGLLLSYGPKWHARRKVLTPTYHFKILERFTKVFDHQSHILVRKLKEKADGKTSFNIFPYVCLAALDNISETAMGVKINAQENPAFPYAIAVKEATNILATRFVKPIFYYDITFILTAFLSYLKLRKSIKIMHNFTNNVIRERKTAMDLQKPSDFDSEVGLKKRMAFLDVLLQATVDGKPLSLQDIREEVDTFMFEGHDTTTSGISFCLYLLSRHPSVQQRVFEEIVHVLGPNKDDPICMQDLQNLKYLEAVIRETLRLYPSVPLIGRHCLQDIQIGDQIIPANSHLIIPLYDIGRDPDYFPQPNEFNPERFYSESPDNIFSFAYVPFSAGPRNCIGQKFAMLEMKATISRLLRHYELLPLGEEVVQVLSLILRSVNGVQLGLGPRKYCEISFTNKMLFIIFLTILLIFIISDYFKKIRLNKNFKANGVGGNRFTLPLIGDLLMAISMNIENFSDYFKSWRQKYGKVYRIWYMEKCILITQDPEYIETILNSSNLLKKPFFYDKISVWLGNGLLLSNGLKWQTVHKAYLPTFHIKKLEQYVTVFDQHSHNMVKKLRPQANGMNAIDVYPLVCIATMDMLLETLMGIKMSADIPEGLAYLKSLKGVVDMLFDRFVKPFQQFDLVYKLISYKSYRSLQTNVKALHDFSEIVIKKKMAEIGNRNTEDDINDNPDNDFDEIDAKQFKTPLDALLQLNIDGKPLTDKEIREEVDNIIFGAFDASSSGISFILYLLSRHPQEQQKVFEEVVNIMGPDPNEPVDMKKLHKMKYLELVIKESLRLYPPAPIIGRVTEEDHKFGDKTIPRNTQILILIYALFRDPDYFPRPNEFVPERFVNDKINSYAYIPFSSGPRNCMGQKYAFLQMKCMVSCVLRHYELLPLGPEVQPTVMLITSSKTGMNMGLRPRVY
ncbi:uncharacterized protein ACRADG_008885 [Cochliomyia hominivorax]